MHHYTGDTHYRDKAEQTLETFAGVAEQFGIFAATYGIAVLHFLENPVQIVVIDQGDGDSADELWAAAVKLFAFTKTGLRLKANQAVAGIFRLCWQTLFRTCRNSGRQNLLLCSVPVQRASLLYSTRQSFRNSWSHHLREPWL